MSLGQPYKSCQLALRRRRGGGGGDKGEDHRDRLAPTLATGGLPKGLLGTSSLDELLTWPESQTMSWKYGSVHGRWTNRNQVECVGNEAEAMWEIRSALSLFAFAVWYSEVEF